MGDPGEDPLLFLDQTEAQRAEKIFFRDHPPPAPLSQGLDDRFPPLPPTSPLSPPTSPLSPPLPPSPPYSEVWIRHCKFTIFCF